MQSRQEPEAEADRRDPADSLATAPLDEVRERLGGRPEGLGDDEARQRLDQYGHNELAEKKRNPLLEFLSYFWGPIPWMIEAAALLSAILQDWTDFGIILALLLMNVGVGFWEEFKAGNTIEALKQKLAHQARVKRAGAWKTVAARDLVPGDIIRIRLGDVIPADARLLDDTAIQVDQSALTGESLPVERGKGGALYSGSILKQGEADALVFATGAKTFIGKAARLAGEEGPPSHFQKAVLQVGNFLIILAVVLVAIILGVALLRGDAMLTSIQFALILTVAAVPVAMPTVLTVTMAIGARMLAAREAIVTRLAAIEELAGIDVLCTDKTGTLTRNELTLDDPYTLEGVTPEELLLAATLASRKEDEDPIDAAILSIAYDRVRYSDEPEAWEMPRVLGLASVLGCLGVIASFGLFYLGERVFHLGRDVIQTLIYLKLSVAGHLTIFVTRTRGPFWSQAPAPILFLAVAGTQVIATLIAVYGIFMVPLGWKWAMLVWAYAIVWFLVNDRVKVLTHRLFDRHRPVTCVTTR